MPPRMTLDELIGSGPGGRVLPPADGTWVQLGCVHAGFVAIAANAVQENDQRTASLDVIGQCDRTSGVLEHGSFSYKKSGSWLTDYSRLL